MKQWNIKVVNLGPLTKEDRALAQFYLITEEK